MPDYLLLLANDVLLCAVLSLMAMLVARWLGRQRETSADRAIARAVTIVRDELHDALDEGRWDVELQQFARSVEALDSIAATLQRELNAGDGGTNDEPGPE